MPAVTELEEAVLPILRSATGLTVVVMVEVLLAGVGSGISLVTVAMLVITPVADGVTTMVTVALAPRFKSSRLQVTVLVPLQLP